MRNEKKRIVYQHPMGRFQVIETEGINAFGNICRIRVAVLTPKMDKSGMLTDADKYDQEIPKHKCNAKLSEEEVKTICELYQDDVTVMEIAKYIGRGLDVVRRVLDRTGLRPRVKKSRSWTDEERKKVYQMWKQQCSMKEIGEAVDRTWKAVAQELSNMRKRQAL